MTDLDRPERVVPVRAERRSRRYDSERGCYVYDISFRTRAPMTDRTIEVAKAFGLGVDDEREHVLYSDFELRLVEGDVVYITGDSGSGKSVLLRALEEDLGDEAANIDDLEVDADRPIIDTVGGSFRESLGLLSRVGLNDAFLFLRRYEELSEGQRYRYRIAAMIDGGKKFWLADEFCSALDRTTARVVAFNIQKLARRSGATLVVATTHTDLKEDLGPSITIRKGWGEEIDVAYGPNVEVPACTVAREVSMREGSREDYRRLGHLHYRDAGLPVPREIYALERGDELVGVIVYSYPPVRASGRKKAVGYAPGLEELNRFQDRRMREVDIESPLRATDFFSNTYNGWLKLAYRHGLGVTVILYFIQFEVLTGGMLLALNLFYELPSVIILSQLTTGIVLVILFYRRIKRALTTIHPPSGSPTEK